MEPAPPDTSPGGLLWVRSHTDDGEDVWSPRVIRLRTERSVYVDAADSPSGTARLDRHDLETEGCAFSRDVPNWLGTFYATAEKQRIEAEAEAEAARGWVSDGQTNGGPRK